MRPGSLQYQGQHGGTCDHNDGSNDTTQAAAQKAEVKPRSVAPALKRLGPQESKTPAPVVETNFLETEQNRPGSGPTQELLWSQCIEPDEECRTHLKLATAVILAPWSCTMPNRCVPTV